MGDVVRDLVAQEVSVDQTKSEKVRKAKSRSAEAA
jgi:hypothetical protein